MSRKWWTLLAVCLGTFMLLIDVTIVNVALPDIQTSLQSSFSDVQWVIDAYSLMLAALLLTSGSLADLFGRRRVFVIGLCIFTVSSLLCGLATTPLFLNLARGAQGVGGAAMFSTSLALLATSFRGRERGTAFGVWGAITGLAVAVGPVVGGALTTGLSWRWIFLVNVPIGVLCVLLTLMRVEESRQPGAHRPDWIGALTFSGALAALVYALIQGNSKGWGSTEIVACLAGSAALLLVFLVAEHAQRAPMFDLSLFRNPTFAGGSVVAFALSAGMFSLLLYLTLYLQDVLGYSALEAGLRLLVISGGILLTSTIAGRLTTRVPIRLLIGPGLVLVGVGLLVMRGLKPSSGWEHLVPGFIVSGVGVGLINPPLASTAVGVVEPARAGMASGINSTFRQIGIATGIAALGAVFSHTVRLKVIGLLGVTAGISSAQADTLASSVAQGTGAGAAIAAAPPAAQAAAVHAVRVGFVNGLNLIFLIGAVVSFGAAALSLILIRNKDFEASAAHLGPPPVEPPAAAAQADPAQAPTPKQAVAPVEGGVAVVSRPEDADTPAEPSPPADPAQPTTVAAAAEPTPLAPPAEPTPPADPAQPTTPPAPPAEATPPADPAQPTTPPAPPAEATRPAAPARPTTLAAPAEPTRPAASAAGPGAGAEPNEPGRRSRAVALAAEQAAADCASYLERTIARALEAERGRTTSGRGESLLGAAGRAAALRGRLDDLAARRRRLVALLAEHTEAAGEHTRRALEHSRQAAVHAAAETDYRLELYGLIAALSALTDEADRLGLPAAEDLNGGVANGEHVVRAARAPATD